MTGDLGDSIFSLWIEEARQNDTMSICLSSCKDWGPAFVPSLNTDHWKYYWYSFSNMETSGAVCMAVIVIVTIIIMTIIIYITFIVAANEAISAVADQSSGVSKSKSISGPLLISFFGKVGKFFLILMVTGRNRSRRRFSRSEEFTCKSPILFSTLHGNVTWRYPTSVFHLIKKYWHF